MKTIVEKILDEIKRQDAKWDKDRNLSDMLWLTILQEEIGESAKCILENDLNLENELIQCVAVIIQWLKNIERRKQNE
jgi:hypothetical protein